MADEYADKMSRKTLPELLLYVQRRAEYREDAVLAALDELERRGELPAEAPAVRAELAPVVAQQRQAQQELQAQQQAQQLARAAPADRVQAASPGSTAEAEGPALYTPGTIVLFSMLFSFLAGGALLVLNMFRLKESGKAVRLVLFILALLLGSSYALQWLMARYGTQMQFFSVGVNLVAVLAYLLYFWPRYVGPRPYVSRQWLPALLVCLVVVFGIYKLMAPMLGGVVK